MQLSYLRDDRIVCNEMSLANGLIENLATILRTFFTRPPQKGTSITGSSLTLPRG